MNDRGRFPVSDIHRPLDGLVYFEHFLKLPLDLLVGKAHILCQFGRLLPLLEHSLFVLNEEGVVVTDCLELNIHIIVFLVPSLESIVHLLESQCHLAVLEFFVSQFKQQLVLVVEVFVDASLHTRHIMIDDATSVSEVDDL